ncbi:axoneme central apparatus [Chrysochromulina tobinii]|uniref:Axoneme central apparatus n=1 Tax=Chrysochromulina tobinii TaxID=1460289 RepID=A0A0M0JFU0_9EUKA|nr:axoneme central apparatus [Chrysochromulina tobinii]|eukprot:KOO25325.1 axoneme central apparatus [Chrysochromulina sp. CCMP291]
MPVGFANLTNWGAGKDVVLPAFAAFQRARVEFAQEVAKLALPAGEALVSKNAASGTYETDGAEKVLSTLEASFNLMPEMRSLLTDVAPTVRENAMLAVGRLCGLSDKLHGQVADPTLLDATISTITSSSQPSLVHAAMFLLHTAVRSSAEVAHLAVEHNALVAVCERLEDTDSQTKQAAVWCLCSIASHEAPLASAVVEAGAVPLLILCLKEHSLPLRRLTLSCLGSIAKHEQVLAEVLHKEGALSAAVEFLSSPDMLLRRHACRALACATQHHTGANEWVPAPARKLLVETMQVADPETLAFAATLAQQLAKHSNSVASSFHDLGAVPLLVAHMRQGHASPTSAAAAIGHICDGSSAAAVAALQLGVLETIHALLASHAPVPVCVVLCQCLGAMSNADETVAKAIDQSGCLQLVLEATLLSKRKIGPAARQVLRAGLGRALGKCASYPVLVFLLERLPFTGPHCEPPILAALLKALARVLSTKGTYRLDFMQRGALSVAQQASKIKSPELLDALKTLNSPSIFPKQMVDATAPDYESKLLDKIV